MKIMLNFFAKVVRALLSKTCRPLYCIIYGRDTSKFYYTRCFCNLLLGFIFAWLCWNFVVLQFKFSFKYKYFILSFLLLLFGCGFVISTSLKCITLLVFVAILGKSGRSFFRALSFAFVIAGAVQNLSTNGEEVIRVFSCSALLSYNLTKTRLDLMTKPFQKSLTNIKSGIKEVQTTFSEMREAVKPIHDEVEGTDESLKFADNVTKSKRQSRVQHAAYQEILVEQRYKQKLSDRCKMQLLRGKKRCKKAFAKEYDDCTNKFPPIVRTILCWPFRVDFICDIDIFGNPDKICDPSEVIPNDFGQNYVTMDIMEHELVKNGSKVKVQYDIHDFDQPTIVKDVSQSTRRVMQEFHTRRHIFDFIMQFLYHMLILLYIKIIIASIRYHNNYKEDIEFDNIYISEYFKRIDDRRKKARKKSILPLKQFEKKTIVDLGQCCTHTKEESKTVLFHLLQFSLEILTGGFFLILDYIVVELMQIVRSRSLITYVQEGEHKIKFHIEGKGLMARLLRSTLQNFNMHERISTYASNEQCLPRPSVLPQRFYIELCALYLVIVVLIFKSTIILRMRRIICSYFYPKREKQRVLFLYNSLLKQRRAYFEMLLKNLEMNVANQQIRTQLNLILRLRLRFPICFGWLKYFAIGRRKCIICEVLEDGKFIVCPHKDCGHSYCFECWREMGTLCPVCNQPIKIVHILNFERHFTTQ